MSSNESNEKLLVAIKIKDFPSRNEIINYFKEFIKEYPPEIEYSIKNKSNEILIVINNNEIALKFMQTFNEEIANNLLYANVDCSLSFQAPQKTILLPKVKSRYKIASSRNAKTNSVNKIRIIKKLTRNHSSFNIASYAERHWADIKSRAGVINLEDPYIEQHTIEYKERLNDKKKWMDIRGFNNNVGLASISKKYFIKNYVRLTPSLPPLLYNFRTPQKNKWLDQSGFNLY